MPRSFPETDPFPASEFDQWASHYDDDVTDESFPFTGYSRVLAETLRLAGAGAGMTILDLGAGTGNLSEMFYHLGCEVWGTDFSSKMIEYARAKIPSAHFYLHDLRRPFPAALRHRFDRIVSAYVFHHFELSEKIRIIEQLMRDMLTPEGRLVIADVSFPTRQAMNAYRQSAGDRWEEEHYWIAKEILPRLDAIRIHVAYEQVSDCAGIYLLSRQDVA